jgi:hypothetical protein
LSKALSLKFVFANCALFDAIQQISAPHNTYMSCIFVVLVCVRATYQRYKSLRVLGVGVGGVGGVRGLTSELYVKFDQQ